MIYSVQFSHSVVSNSLWPHGVQHAKHPCLSPIPGACSNSCPLSRWCHPSTSFSVLPSPSLPAFNLSLHQDLFQWVSSSYQMAKLLELQHQSFQLIFRTDFLSDWLVGSSCSPRDSQEPSTTPQFKSINSLVLSFLYGPGLTSIHDSRKKTRVLTIWNFIGKVMSLLFNMLSRLVIAFLPRSKCL